MRKLRKSNEVACFLVGVLIVGLLISGCIPVAFAQEKRNLIIIGHQVHRQSATAEETGAMGINLVEKFEKEHPNVKVIYETYPNPKVQEKLNRLGPLSSCKEDIIHVLNSWAVPRVANFLEPLDPFLETKVLEDFPGDYPTGLVEIGRIKGSFYTIPVRVCYSGMQWVNMKILRERGIEYQPTLTPEEFYDIARKCAFTRPTGEKVFGHVWRGTVSSVYEPFDRFARWFGGVLITKDFKCTVNEPPAVKGLELLQRLYQENIAPPNIHVFDYAEEVKMFSENRSAFFNGNTSYGKTFNDPTKSKIAGHAVMVKHSPPSGHSSIWGMGILKGSDDKDLAWEYIRLLCSKEGALSMGLSGTTPARNSTLVSPEYSQNNPAGLIEAETAPYSEPVWPAFENANEAIDLIGSYCQTVIARGSPVQAQMDQLAEELKRLLP